MVSSRIFIPTLALALVAECKIRWSPCNPKEFNTTLYPLECASYDVPLDYSDPECSETLTLELLKAPAPLESRGSILFNLGGPGSGFRADMTSLIDRFIPLTGGKYDLVGFDPRGTANTIPLKCTNDSTLEYQMYEAQQPLGATTAGTLWARGQVDAEICHQNAGRIGSLMSTAFVARDLISVVDALEEDGKLRYWGLSYGTTLGATVTAMFPDRIDKVIFDGVQNPHEYYHAQANFEEWTDADKSFSAIFSTCVEAGPKKCPLAAHGKTAQELEAAAWDLLETVRVNPIVVGRLVLDYGRLKGIYSQVLYTANAWPIFSTVLDMLIFNTEGPLAKLLSSFGAGQPGTAQVPSQIAGDLALAGIYCGDNQVRTSSLDEFEAVTEKLKNISRTMGEMAAGSYARCQQWKIKPKEVYTGGFEVQLKNPALFIGNTFDAHTPLVSAYNVSQGYEGSVVLELYGYGHGSTAVPSVCSLRTISAYWLDGKLPEPNTVCHNDAPPYSGLGWPDVLKKAGVDGALIIG